MSFWDYGSAGRAKQRDARGGGALPSRRCFVPPRGSIYAAAGHGASTVLGEGQPPNWQSSAGGELWTTAPRRRGRSHMVASAG